MGARAQPGPKAPTDDQDKVNMQCESDYEDAQRAQNAGHLHDAKDKYGKCSADACPKSVRAECGKTASDLAASIPTVVFDAVDGDGKQIVATRVIVDGNELQSSIDGHAVEMDPGPHKVRFEAPGKKPYELDVAVLEGWSHHTVQGTFGEKAEGAGGDHPFGVVPWVVAGGGALLLVVGIAVIVPGENNIETASQACTNHVCKTQAEVDLGNQGIAMATAGKVLIPVGAIALGSGLVWQLLFNKKSASSGPKVSFQVGPLGGGLSVRSSF